MTPATAEPGPVVEPQPLDALLDQCRTALLWDSADSTHIGLFRRKAMKAIDQYRNRHKGEPSAVDALKACVDVLARGGWLFQDVGHGAGPELWKDYQRALALAEAVPGVKP